MDASEKFDLNLLPSLMYGQMTHLGLLYLNIPGSLLLGLEVGGGSLVLIK